MAKRLKSQEHAKITIASEATKRYLMETALLISSIQLKAAPPSQEGSPNPTAPEVLKNFILIKGLSLDTLQLQISVGLHKLMGSKNVLALTFNKGENDSLGRYDGIATIRCLNTAIYTHWCNRKAIPFLSKSIDFAPHARSLAGSHPVATTKQQDQRPTREVIVEAIIAFKNESVPTPILHQLIEVMQIVEGRIKNHLTDFGGNINIHTSSKIDHVASTTTEQRQCHHTFLVHKFQLLTFAAQDYSTNMSGIFLALNYGLPKSSLAPHALLPPKSTHDSSP